MVVNTLISPSQIDDSYTFVDCRFSLTEPDLGEQQYRASHIAGSHYAHLNHDLSGKIVAGKTGRHPLPEKPDLIEFLSELGIKNSDKIVAYDAGNATYAARLWWLMRWLGHTQVWVLDGGFTAWQANGGQTSQTVPMPSRSNYEPQSSLTNQIDASSLDETPLTITDARDPARFRGDVEPIDPIAGHIPSAINLPFTNNLTDNESLKNPNALAQQFEQVGLDKQQPTICYCGSGVTACNNILALLHAGYPEPVLYPGSWSEWILAPEREIAIGD